MLSGIFLVLMYWAGFGVRVISLLAGYSSFLCGISCSSFAPSVDGGVFRGTAEEVSVEGVFNDFSGIVLVRKNQIGDFKVKRSAVLAFQPAQLEGHGFVGKDQLAGPAVAYF